MRYELKKGSTLGIITDRTPIIGNVKGTSFEVSFSFVDEKGLSYTPNAIAYIESPDGNSEKVLIKDGKITIPFWCAKHVNNVFSLAVLELGDRGEVKNKWTCPPFKITTFYNSTISLVELICGLTDEDWLKLLQEVKQENETILNTLASLQKSIDEYKNEVATLKDDCANIARAHNALVEEFNKHKEEI